MTVEDIVRMIQLEGKESLTMQESLDLESLQDAYNAMPEADRASLLEQAQAQMGGGDAPADGGGGGGGTTSHVSTGISQWSPEVQAHNRRVQDWAEAYGRAQLADADADRSVTRLRDQETRQQNRERNALDAATGQMQSILGARDRKQTIEDRYWAAPGRGERLRMRPPSLTRFGMPNYDMELQRFRDKYGVGAPIPEAGGGDGGDGGGGGAGGGGGDGGDGGGDDGGGGGAGGGDPDTDPRQPGGGTGDPSQDYKDANDPLGLGDKAYDVTPKNTPAKTAMNAPANQQVSTQARRATPLKLPPNLGQGFSMDALGYNNPALQGMRSLERPTNPNPMTVGAPLPPPGGGGFMPNMAPMGPVGPAAPTQSVTQPDSPAGQNRLLSRLGIFTPGVA